MYTLKEKLYIFSKIFVVLFLLLGHSERIGAALSDKRLCADERCQNVISIGKAEKNYDGAEEGLISFKIHSNIRVKSKGAGSNPDLWGIEVNGREGFAPKKFIVEHKIMVPDEYLKYEVPVKLPSAGAKNSAARSGLANETEKPKVPTGSLKPSENDEIKAEIVATTTSPLEEQTLHKKPSSPKADDSATRHPIITSGDTDSSEPLASVNEITPVQPKMEIIDGTAIPILEELSTQSPPKRIEGKQAIENKKVAMTSDEKLSPGKKLTDEFIGIVNDVDDDDGDVGDYDEEDDDDDDDNEDDIDEEKVKRDLEKVNSSNNVIKKKENAQLNEHVLYKHNSENEIKEEDTHKSLNEQFVELKNEKRAKEEENKNKEDSLPVNVADEANNTIQTSMSSENKHKESVIQNYLANDLQASNDSSKKSEEEDLEAEVLDESTDPRDYLKIEENKINENLEHAINVNDSESTGTTGDAVDPNKETNDMRSESTTVLPKMTEAGYELPSISDYMNLNVEDTTTAVPITTVHSLTTAKPIIENSVVDSSTNKEGKDDTTENKTEERPSAAVAQMQVSVVEQVPAGDQVPAVEQVPFVGQVAAVDQVPITTGQLAKTTKPIVEHSVMESKTNKEEKDEKSAIKTEKTTSAVVEQIQVPAVEQVTAGVQMPVVDQASVAEQVPAVHEVRMPVDDQMPVVKQIPSLTDLPLYSPPPPLDAYTPPLPEDPEKSVSEPQGNHADQHNHQETHQHSHSNEQQNHINYHNSQYHYHGHKHPAHEGQEGTSKYVEHSNDEIITNSHSEEITEKHLEKENKEIVTSSEEITTMSGDQDDINTSVYEKHEENDHKPNALPIASAPIAGLFGTIVGTVKNLLGNQKKDLKLAKSPQIDDNELERILFPDHVTDKQSKEVKNDEYCEKLTADRCPERSAELSEGKLCNCEFSDINIDNFAEILTSKLFEMGDLIVCLAMAAASVIFFVFGYYCFCNSSKEGALLSRLNLLERSLLATHKENAILKDDLVRTRHKLSKIEDNSFGSNDMVIALKQELEYQVGEKEQLQDQIKSLEKELENAAEAGLELNRIVSELLSNQTGDESIISSVEELQMQLNEQQQTILEINTNLAEKSRENSELQLMIAEQNARMSGEIASLQQDNDELEAEKGNLKQRLDEMKSEFEEDILKALEGKNQEIKRLQNEILDLKTRVEDEHTKWQTSLAKVEALEECLKSVKKDPSVNIKEVIDVANVRAELLDLQRKRNSLKQSLDAEMDTRKLAENQLQIAVSEVEKLKQDFNQSEKEKLEAQTRLEILANYFKDKETQLQKELSLKEAMWLKQQGEKTSTVERVTAMQEEIQSLKSQNDALRAEIEAQSAAHKAQIGTLEHRAHETWLAARQSERRYDESRAEATALRRKLTTLAGNSSSINAADVPMNSTDAPSPIHMEQAASPLLSRLPPPPPFLPPHFMGPPPPFMNMPPPPFLTPVEMRPAPLGRMMSPPLGGRYSPDDRDRNRDRSDRNDRRYYDDDYDDEDDDDEDDYDVDDDDDGDDRHHRRRRRSWQRDSPPAAARSYRSHSPADSRYNYTTDRDLMSTYDTENDFSPPPSPRRDNRGRRDSNGDGEGGGSDGAARPLATSSKISRNENGLGTKPKRNGGKGVLSSGSEKSSNSAQKQSRRNKKTMV